MKKHLSKKRVVLAAIVVVALAIASGVAYAYWTSGGTGGGTATAAASTSSITVNQTSTVDGLYPNATPVALSGDFTSTNSGLVHITSVTGAVTGVTNAGTDPLKPACAASDFAVTGSFAPTNGYDVPTGTHKGAWDGMSIQLVDNSHNQDNCKGASATITYTVNNS